MLRRILNYARFIFLPIAAFGLLAVVLAVKSSSALAQGSAFTYQGKLSDGGVPANGSFGLQFKLFDAPASPQGIQQGPTITLPVTVTNGIFTVTLDFGVGVFSGADRFLEIAIQIPGGYTLLTPRQPIASSPYSIKTFTATYADSLSSACVGCVKDIHVESVEGAKVTGVVNQAVNAANADNVTGVVQIANGGTGSSAKNFVDLSSNQGVAGDKTFSGAITVGSLSGNGSGLTNIPGTFSWHAIAGTSQQAQPNTGYVANNPNQVTITLPTTPSVGDTLRVLGRGSGGWKLAQNPGQSVLAGDLPLAYEIWTPRETNRSWKSVASSADGTKLVAVTISDQIFTSTNSGVIWTPHESSRQWTAVASSSDGNRLVAVSGLFVHGQIYTSSDSGATWTPRESNRLWTAAASSADGSKLVATAAGPGKVYTSTDFGVTWTPREDNRAWTGVASSSDGTKLVAVASGDEFFEGRIYTSTDSGVSWTPRWLSTNWTSVASSGDGTKLIAASSGASGQIFISTNSGVDWIARGHLGFWTAVASSFYGDRLIALQQGSLLYMSTDSGTSWIPHDSARTWQAAACSANGHKLVALGDNQIYTSSGETTPGTVGYLIGQSNAAIELQYIGNGQFLTTKHQGTLVIR